VLDIDVRAFFDSVPHDLMLKAVARQQRWSEQYRRTPRTGSPHRGAGHIEDRARLSLSGHVVRRIDRSPARLQSASRAGRAVAVERIGAQVGSLSPDLLASLDEALRLHLSL